MSTIVVNRDDVDYSVNVETICGRKYYWFLDRLNQQSDNNDVNNSFLLYDIYLSVYTVQMK